jgi:hypothetical protein
MTNSGSSLNDRAWEYLFEQHKILDVVEHQGYFEIDASSIREVREPRLMTKFDHAVNLPKIFRKNKLAILPMTRSRYVIGRFRCYQDVDYTHNQDFEQVNFPSDVLQSIDYQNLYSESSALHCAYVCEMIQDILGEPAYFTVSGRMSSREINFDIETFDGMNMPLHVKNAQIEIDAGFESENYFMVVEAKQQYYADRAYFR